ncbi:MAG: DUF2892 domain-containing protein [Bacteroidota bacterium]|nr:DUF2892 domain-containing protein [Bacteroidota bacterium]
MKPNIGSTDKLIRIFLAIAIGVLYFTEQINGTAAIILLILAAVLILTSLISVCPLYLPFGLSTRKK